MIRFEQNPAEDGFGVLVGAGVGEVRSCARAEAAAAVGDVDCDVTGINSTIVFIGGRN